jgi:hypothetical protein
VLRLGIVTCVTLLACRDREAATTAPRSPLETGIARDLTARFRTSVTASCKRLLTTPVRCTATLADGSELPIALEAAARDEWGWRVDGLVVEARAVAAYVEAELASLQLAQTVTCGAPLQVVQPGDRVSCTLSGGGVAFVTLDADGQPSLELALDAAAAAARSELVTPDRDRALEQQSRALQVLEWESDGEEPVATDGGVSTP